MKGGEREKKNTSHGSEINMTFSWNHYIKKPASDMCSQDCKINLFIAELESKKEKKHASQFNTLKSSPYFLLGDNLYLYL